MVLKNLDKYDIVLASGSPRRHALLKDLGVDFRVEQRPVEENFPPGMDENEIAVYLSKLKADAFDADFFAANTMLITADTIVCLEGKLLGKPGSRAEAFEMLRQLSGKRHQVITGMSIRISNREVNFSVGTDVYFKDLEEEEIEYYVDTFRPYDKAGAYGIQEWIGFAGIEKIDGSFYNVMGLPLHRLYEELRKF
ncbi:MAG: Maf family nucleotide pyrophosphatase [Bacteroidales bacterium]|jgi:septum formation protein|nr:Maf family nucleotide pyrophosphatase [Bacteroidales bacterium]